VDIRQFVAYRVLLTAAEEVGNVDVWDQRPTKSVPTLGESIRKANLLVKVGGKIAESGIEIVTQPHVSILQLQHGGCAKSVRVADAIVLGWKFRNIGKFRSAARTILVVAAG